jgi:inner membrane protein
MTVKGHIALATVIIQSTNYYFGLVDKIELISNPLYISMIIAFYLGVILPDIDEPKSYIGRKLPFISHITGSLIKHRTFTHYLITFIAISLIAYLFVADNFLMMILFSISFGMFVHTLGELVTGGIRGYFFPFYSNKSIIILPRVLNFDVNGVVENILIYLVFTPFNLYLFYRVFV